MQINNQETTVIDTCFHLGNLSLNIIVLGRYLNKYYKISNDKY